VVRGGRRGKEGTKGKTRERDPGTQRRGNGAFKGAPNPLLGPKRQTARFRQDIIHDHDAGAAFQGRDEIAQDADAVFVGPVVEDPAEEVDVGGVDLCGLWGQEVVGLEGDAVGEGGGDFGGPVAGDLR